MKTPAFNMLDLETLGTKPGCPVIQMAVVHVPEMDIDEPIPEGFEAYYTNINPTAGRYANTEPDTVGFWINELQKGHNPFSHVDTVPERQVHEALVDWLVDHKADVWMARGITFDFPILAAMFEHHDQPVPWGFWELNCTRSYKTIARMLGLDWPDPNMKHNALGDAMNESINVLRLFRRLLAGGGEIPRINLTGMVEEKGTHLMGNPDNQFPENTNGQKESS